MPTKKNLGPFMRGDTWSLQVKFSDTVEVCDGAASVNAPTKIISATAAFNSTHLNQKITLAGAGAGGEDYSGKIIGIDSGTQVTVCPNIKTTVTGAVLSFGKAVNITGDTLWFTLKLSNDDVDPGIFQVSTVMPANAESVAGVGHIVAIPAKTIFTAGGITYKYDIQRVIPGSPPTVQTPVYGDIPVLEHTTIAAA